MPEYFYQAKNGPASVIEGTIVAPTQQQAIQLIEEKGYVPIEVVLADHRHLHPQPSAKSKPEKLTAGPSKRASKPSKPEYGARAGKIPVYEVCVFTRQMAGFLKSHVPLLSALELIKKQTSSPKIRALLVQVTDRVRNGEHFSEALERAGHRSFDARYIGMLKAGESSGSIDAVLETLANYLEAEEEIRGQINSALAYPVFIVCVGFGTLFFLFTFCVPRLTHLFSQTFSSLPLPTRILMGLSRPEWQFFFWGMFAALVGFVAYFFSGGDLRRKQRDAFFSRVPILGSLRVKADIARFASTLSMLIKNGIPVYQAIETTRPVLSNELLKDDLKDAQKRILAGEMLAAVVRDAGHFPPFVSQMISVGEESGQLAGTLEEISRFYSRESLRGVKMLTSLIEPAFILILSLIVGLVVAGIMLPIFDMNWVK